MRFKLAVVLLLSSIASGAASPLYQVGDSFSGTISINPNTPLASGGSGDYFYNGPNIGFFSLSVSGNQFASLPIARLFDSQIGIGGWAIQADATATSNFAFAWLTSYGPLTDPLLPIPYFGSSYLVFGYERPGVGVRHYTFYDGNLL